MSKKTATILLTLFAGLVMFSSHASAQTNPSIHLAVAYHKTGNRYSVVAKGTPGDKVDLYVNDQHPPVQTTVGKDGWATFNWVKLVGSGKISFTRVLQGANNSTYQQPINFTEHYVTQNQQATFAYNNVHIHVAIAYYKGNNRYDIVAKNNPSQTLELYVNDKNPTQATVNNDDWATFHGVQLTGSGKISFTHVYTRNDGTAFQWPINFTEHYVIANNNATFTVTKSTPKKVAPKLAPVSKPATMSVPNTPTCTNGTYVNSSGNTVCRPETSSSVPAGATAKCVDGTYSFSQHHSGTCSHHGGVAEWL